MDSVITNSATDGLDIGGQPFPGVNNATLAGSVVTKNIGIGVNIIGSTVGTYGDNEINGNGTDVSGTFTPLAKK